MRPAHPTPSVFSSLAQPICGFPNARQRTQIRRRRCDKSRVRQGMLVGVIGNDAASVVDAFQMLVHLDPSRFGEFERHFESRQVCLIRWNALSSTRWRKMRLRRLISAPSAIGIVPPRRADPPPADWGAARFFIIFFTFATKA